MDRVLAGVPRWPDENVLIGFDTADDAGVCVIMGPGDSAKAHSPNECVPIADLEAAVPIFMRLAEEI